MVIGIMVLALGFHVGHAMFSNHPPRSPTDLPWVPLSTGKERSFVSKTRDAGMYTETLRRLAVINGSCGGARVGNYTDKSSTNGSLETYFITGLCPVRLGMPICPPDTNEIDDGGNADTETCNIIDENGGELIDFGDANTNVCPT